MVASRVPARPHRSRAVEATESSIALVHENVLTQHTRDDLRTGIVTWIEKADQRL